MTRRPRRGRLHGARILVLGGGFGGMYTALNLERRLRGPLHELTLVSNENYMLYTPLLPEAAAGALEPRHVVVPLRTALKRTQVIVATVVRVDVRARTVAVRPPEGPDRAIGYDQLVFALGSATRMPDTVPGLTERAVGFKNLAEAIYLRNRVLQHLELADATSDHDARRKLLTFVFVGGGYAGVEAAAELHAMAEDALRYYPNLVRAELRFVVVEAGPSVLRELGDAFAGRVERRLAARGIEILTATTLREVRADAVVLSSDEVVPTETVVWTAGVCASSLTAHIPAQKDALGRIVTTPGLQVPGLPGVWALGDSAAVPDDATRGQPAPATAQHALRQARTLANNLAATLEGGTLLRFSHGTLGMLATLGTHDGAGRLLGVPVHGFLAWWIVRTYHLLQLPTVARKVRVVLDWTIALFFPRDIAQLGSLGRVRPRAEADQAAAGPG
ncbi:MAG: NAD(P)/FAD-dependent oxidoreductase [Gemmatimonadetes bacterium]|nr:NAD(P)/FAD-dependent oxidoreductase [Gemmatimonadota bacterium]